MHIPFPEAKVMGEIRGFLPPLCCTPKTPSRPHDGIVAETQVLAIRWLSRGSEAPRVSAGSEHGTRVPRK